MRHSMNIATAMATDTIIAAAMTMRKAVTDTIIAVAMTMRKAVTDTIIAVAMTMRKAVRKAKYGS